MMYTSEEARILAKQHRYVVMFAEDYLREKGLWNDFLDHIREKAERLEAEEREKYKSRPYPVD